MLTHPDSGQIGLCLFCGNTFGSFVIKFAANRTRKHCQKAKCRRTVGFVLSLALFGCARDFIDLVQRQHEEIRAELEHFDQRHESEAEPQAKHAAKIRYVLNRLHRTEQPLLNECQRSNKHTVSMSRPGVGLRF